MTGSAPFFRIGRRAAFIAAAGFLLSMPASAQTQLPPPAYGQADTRQDRIEELEGQLREAEARNEDLQRQLAQANREVQRLRGMVGELSSVNQSLQQAPAQEQGASGPAPLTPPAQRAPAPTPAPAAETPSPQARATGTLGTIPATVLPGSEGEAYSYARELLANGRYAEAEAAFGQFLQTYPNAITTSDARFLFAFTQLARNNYRDAAQNFIQYLRAAPQGPRAPEAQVRLGMAFAGLAQDGTNDAAELRQACSAFSSLPRQFPNAPRHVRDLAQREARAANCPT